MNFTSRFVFTEELKTGSKLIDDEHRELLNVANRLFDACSSGEGKKEVVHTLRHLLDYVDTHFEHEDAFMREKNYSLYEEHHAFHVNFNQDFKATASEILLKGEIDSMSLMKIKKKLDVLVAHIKSSDRRFGQEIFGQFNN